MLPGKHGNFLIVFRELGIRLPVDVGLAIVPRIAILLAEHLPGRKGAQASALVQDGKLDVHQSCMAYEDSGPAWIRGVQGETNCLAVGQRAATSSILPAIDGLAKAGKIAALADVHPFAIRKNHPKAREPCKRILHLFLELFRYDIVQINLHMI
ncbi:hypothetical protein SDC9_140429 [bioreactor metagenome]|uniref:Uncharacterized protein n=1 Tax=bioreactor metagenome TaxID=1076179 RepID=A0A645DXG4_9ZZZZ